MILELGKTLLKELPNNFRYNGTVDFSNSDIEDLPDSIYIGGDLILTNSKISYIPGNAVIVGDIYITDFVAIDDGALVQGAIIKENGKKYFYDAPGHVIYTDDNKRIVFKSKTKYKQNFDTLIDYFYPALFFYKSIKEGEYAVQYSEEEKTFCFYCTSARDGMALVNWNRAKEKGLEGLKDLDIYELRSVKELEEIYKICTSCCSKGPQDFIEEFSININQKYSINDLRDLVLKTKLATPGAHVFLEYFDPEKKKKEVE